MMSPLKNTKVAFTLAVGQSGKNNLSFFVDGESYLVDETHPHYDEIWERVQSDDPTVVELYDIEEGVGDLFAPLTERVVIRNGEVLFDNDLADDSLTQAMLECYKNGEEDQAIALANFFEKLAQNPSDQSQHMLYNFLQNTRLTILSNGDMVAYKGIMNDRRSIHSGKGVVDGEPIEGHIPNEDGSTIEVPRSYVNDDIDVACSTGLHAGTYEYASTWSSNAGVVVAVAINPRDVIAVPRDHGSQKIRCCRYKVLNKVDFKYDGLVFTLYDDDVNEWRVPEKKPEPKSQTRNVRYGPGADNRPSYHANY